MPNEISGHFPPITRALSFHHAPYHWQNCMFPKQSDIARSKTLYPNKKIQFKPMRSFFWDFYVPNRKSQRNSLFCFICDCENIIIYIFYVVSFCSRLNKIFWFLSRCQFIIFNLGKFFHKKFIASFINGKVEKLFFCFLLWMFVFSFFFQRGRWIEIEFLCEEQGRERWNFENFWNLHIQCAFLGVCAGLLGAFKALKRVLRIFDV